MCIVNFNTIGVAKGHMGAVHINKLQYVVHDVLDLRLGFIDGTESIVPLDPEKNDQRLWTIINETIINDSMRIFDKSAIDLSRIAEIRYFPDGDPDDENAVASLSKSVVRIWFDNGELYFRHAQATRVFSFAENLIKEWMKYS